MISSEPESPLVPSDSFETMSFSSHTSHWSPTASSSTCIPPLSPHRSSGILAPAQKHYHKKFKEKQKQLAATLPEIRVDGTSELPKPNERPFPPPPPLSSIRPLPNIVVIPQRRPGQLTRGFAKLYSPLLEACGIDETTWEGFLKSLNNSLSLTPALSTFTSVLDLATFVVPCWEFSVAAPIAGIFIQYVNGKKGRVRGNAYLEHANEQLFRPRGLIACMLTVNEYRELTRGMLMDKTGCGVTVNNPIGNVDNLFGAEFDPYRGYDPFGGEDGYIPSPSTGTSIRAVDEEFETKDNIDYLVFPRIFIPPDNREPWEGHKYWPRIKADEPFVPGSATDPDPAGILAPLAPLRTTVSTEKNTASAFLNKFDRWRDSMWNRRFARRCRHEDEDLERAIFLQELEERRRDLEKSRKRREVIGWGPMFFVVGPYYESAA